jgi:hypothetical protein
MRSSAKTAGNAAKRTGAQTTDAVHDAVRDVEAAARDVETAARQAASQYSGFVKQTMSEVYTDIAEAYSDIAREFSEAPKPKAKKKKKRSPLEKKSGKFISTVLLLISIALFIIGANTMAGAARDIWGDGLNRWPDFWLGAFYFFGALIPFFSRNIVTRRYSRYKNYYAFVAGRGAVPISDIAQAAGLSQRVVTRDIQAMINAGYFDSGAYIDSELDLFVLSAEAAETFRNAERAERDASVQSEEKYENEYMSVILELRELGASIADVGISRKVDRIGELTAKIFRIVEENPEKQPQIRRFMSYYLPTTLKLLRSYATLEKQGIKGENIMGAKENIGRILDTLVTGYEQQLDQLFKSDALDIAADINVLENLMQQDGLTSDKSEFKTMSGTM